MTENQFNELFRLVTTAINNISDVKKQLDSHEKRFDRLESRFDGLENRFDALQNEVREFRAETGNNFKQVAKEFKSLNVRDHRRERESAEMRVEIDELNERVDVLEQKAA